MDPNSRPSMEAVFMFVGLAIFIGGLVLGYFVFY